MLGTVLIENFPLIQARTRSGPEKAPLIPRRERDG